MHCKRLLVAICAALTICCAMPFVGCASTGASSPDLEPHLTAQGDARPVRPISARVEQELSDLPDAALTAKQYRARVEELYAIVVFDGKQPVFAENDPVKPIYDNAIAVLDRYILNAWHADGNEYEVIHAIHDWSVASIDYDFALYNAYQNGNTDLANDPAFHIDGVFINGKAVCDGLSRAFNFLCAIEGVESLRITGSYASVPHAWNKVKLGGAWYNVDVTADMVYYSVGDGMRKQLSHGYFLLSDKTIGEFAPQGHVFGAQSHVAESDFDYFADTTLTVGGKTYSATVTSKSDLNALFSAVSSQNGRVGKLELKLDFPDKVQINSADMYASEISTAYGKLDDPDFDISAVNKPYFRFPNGVYVFLMYK